MKLWKNNYCGWPIYALVSKKAVFWNTSNVLDLFGRTNKILKALNELSSIDRRAYPGLKGTFLSTLGVFNILAASENIKRKESFKCWLAWVQRTSLRTVSYSKRYLTEKELLKILDISALELEIYLEALTYKDAGEVTVIGKKWHTNQGWHSRIVSNLIQQIGWIDGWIQRLTP